MNAITNFTDANGLVTDAGAFLAADEATQRAVIARWRAHDAQQALAFRDHTLADFATDAIGRAFLTPQLYRIETEVYMRKYPSFDITGLMTVVTDGDMWDIGTVFMSMDTAGRAEFLSGKGFDMPYAGVDFSQFTQPFHLAGIGYEWTTQEMERAAKLGRSLSADKAMAADQAAQAFIFSIAMTGRTPGAATSEKNWTGLVNNASAPAANVPADGTGSSTTFATKTADQILRDVNASLEAVVTNTLETHTANTILFPTSTFQQLARTRVGDTNLTVLEFIRQNNAYKALTGQELTIRATRALETAGAGGTKRMVAYDNSREVIRFHLPGPHQFIAPFQKGAMTWEVPGVMNVGGTEVRLPKAIAYRDGI